MLGPDANSKKDNKKDKKKKEEKPKCTVKSCGQTGYTPEKCWVIHPELKPEKFKLIEAKRAKAKAQKKAAEKDKKDRKKVVTIIIDFNLEDFKILYDLTPSDSITKGVASNNRFAVLNTPAAKNFTAPGM